MQLNYVGMQNTGTYVAFWKNLSYESWEGQTYTNSWQAKNFFKIKVGTWGGGGVAVPQNLASKNKNNKINGEKTNSTSKF